MRKTVLSPDQREPQLCEGFQGRELWMNSGDLAPQGRTVKEGFRGGGVM